ncbi:MAG: hypothetical protein NVS2B12_10580 [Ktedonobacteraceae bacterium]
MNEDINVNSMTNSGGVYRSDDPQSETQYTNLARWLQQVLQAPEREELSSSEREDSNDQLELVLKSDYHLVFYQQIPDFIMALLTNDSLATVHYASLLFHIAGCHTCHNTYLDLYSSMRAAINPLEMRPSLGQGTRSLAAIPHRMLGHLCRSLISQARALLQLSHRDHEDRDAAARSLLQLALRISAPISQSSIRREALQDLVQVATLFDGVAVAEDDDPRVKKYTPVMAGSGHMRCGKAVRRAVANPLANNPENAVIQLQSQALEGSIVQNGEVLELHLHDLAAALRGRFVTVSVLLGSLFEPVRWLGGNPSAIRSSTAVNEQGTLIMPVGSTDLKLTNPEERNLLEAMFMLLEVRALDEV